MPTPPAAARRLWTLLEPVHAVVYFSREPQQALSDAGYRGYWMGYFAQRAAPLGAVGPELVRALFYNFSADRIGRALPAAWAFAPPEVALQARLDGSVQALRRLLEGADGSRLASASELAWSAATSAPLEGRPLAAANVALLADAPDDPVVRLWLASTVLREHRGDGHVAALLTAGVPGRVSHVLHSVAADRPREVYRVARDYEDEEWAASLAWLDECGCDLQVLKQRVEDTTDVLAAEAFAGLSVAELVELEQALLPVARAVVAGGEIPLDAPMGLDLRPLMDMTPAGTG